MESPVRVPLTRAMLWYCFLKWFESPDDAKDSTTEHGLVATWGEGGAWSRARIVCSALWFGLACLVCCAELALGVAVVVGSITG
jgi:hypothetical protein